MNIRVHGVPSDTLTAVLEAMSTDEPFGLTHDRKTNIVVFHPGLLQSWWIASDGVVKAAYTYSTRLLFHNAVTLQLASHNVLVTKNEILGSSDLQNAIKCYHTGTKLLQTKRP